MGEKVNLCLNCLKETDKNICPNCGFNRQEYISQLPKHDIIPMTILNNKYTICKVLGESTYGITYQAIEDNNTPLAIKEFYPFGYATRNCQESTKINEISPEKKEVFDQGKKQFIEEGQKLKSIKNTKGIAKVFDVFEENNLAYIVEEKIDGIKLDQYIIKQGGKIPVEKALKMIKPVMQTLFELHNKGISHRGICPENIIVDKDDNLKLIGFGASRDLASQDNKILRAQLYTGYSPEELYTAQDTAGAHSDIYSLGATIYKMITGITPPESLDRRVIDDVKPLSKVQLGVKEEVSKAVQKAMSVFKEDRTQTVKEFYKNLYSEEIDNVKEEINEEKEKLDQKKEEIKEKAKEQKEKLGQKKEEIKEKTIEQKEKLGQKKEEIKEKTKEQKEKLDQKKEEIKEKTKEQKEKLDQKKEEIKEKTIEQKEKLDQKKEEIKEKAKEQKEKLNQIKEEIKKDEDEFDESYPNLKKFIIIIIIFVTLFFIAKHFK